MGGQRLVDSLLFVIYVTLTITNVLFSIYVIPLNKSLRI